MSAEPGSLIGMLDEERDGQAELRTRGVHSTEDRNDHEIAQCLLIRVRRPLH